MPYIAPPDSVHIGIMAPLAPKRGKRPASKQPQCRTSEDEVWLLCSFSEHDCVLRHHKAFDHLREEQPMLKEHQPGAKKRKVQCWTERASENDASVRKLLLPNRRKASLMAFSSVVPRMSAIELSLLYRVWGRQCRQSNSIVTLGRRVTLVNEFRSSTRQAAPWDFTAVFSVGIRR